MNQAKVSIVMPIFNASEYLHQSLGELVKQTLNDIEIICVNDGSTDNSLDIIQQYAYHDPRIKIIDKKNSGYGNTMNMGISIAQGDYIGILEPDDFPELNMYESLYQQASLYDADVVKSNYFEYSQKQNSNMFCEVLSGQPYNQVINAWENEWLPFLRPCIWSAIYKRTLIQNSNILFNETPGASYQDTAFAFKVWVCAKKVVFIKDAYLHYRIDNDNSSVKSSGKVFSICDEFQAIQAFLNQNRDYKNHYSKILQVLKLDSYNWNLQRIAPEFKDMFKDQMALDFIKADYDKVLDRAYFDDDRWNLLQSLMNEYKNKNFYIEDLKKEILDLRNSHSYRIGHVLMILPGKFKRILHNKNC